MKTITHFGIGVVVTQHEIKLATAVRERVEQRIDDNLCLGKRVKRENGKVVRSGGKPVMEDCPNQAGERRHVCGSCYTKFNRNRNSLPKRDRAGYEAKIIKAGLIAESHQGAVADVDAYAGK